MSAAFCTMCHRQIEGDAPSPHGECGDCADYREWWDALTPELKRDELRMIAAYVAVTEQEGL